MALLLLLLTSLLALLLLYVNVNAAQNIIQKTLTHFCARVAHTHTHNTRTQQAHIQREILAQGRFRPQFVVDVVAVVVGVGVVDVCEEVSLT